MSHIVTRQKSTAVPPIARPPSALRARLLALPRRHKRLLQVTVDTCLIWLALWLAFYLRLDDVYAAQPFGGHAWLFIAAPLLTLPVFFGFGLYRAVMRYVGYQALATVAMATSMSAALLAIAVSLHPEPPAIVPRSAVIIYWLLSLMFIAGLRLAMRQYFRGVAFNLHSGSFLHINQLRDPKVRVAIYGAGDAGNQLLMALRLNNERHPVAFIDDNLELAGRIIAGLPVFGPGEIARMLMEKNPQEVLLAIPSASRARRAEIVRLLAPYPFSVRTIPGFMDLASGRVQVQDLREVDISDLLGRDSVQPDQQLFERCIRDQVVMVTGAGGSIGAELCRQIVQNRPRTLILFEQSEFNLYSIQSELDRHVKFAGIDLKIIPVLSSVRNQERLFNVMSIWKVDTVYHAAAYKHVPMVERNIAEGIINNIFGTLYSAQAALRAGVPNFVLISTDKAVRPTNIMGCTKRVAELVLQALACEALPCPYGSFAEHSIPNRTRFTMVRFGNVLGSSGSVIPLFREQIRAGGPVTVTHPEITRYFMTIPEAAQLVIQAGAMGQGGDVFVLDMGEPVKIAELARKMILLSGLSVCSPHNPNGDIDIEFVGLRPGEKLYEELLIGENVSATEHPMIMRANETHLEWEQLKSALTELGKAVKYDNYPRIRELFLELVDGYKPDDELVDWIDVQQRSAGASARDVDRFAPAIRPEIAQFEV
ncbi:polysaccharide biosynthesis protein [Candidimonas sp. SYP-B2681]|uniref:polysaccharide biosynthesis protein n=1 Tax=Candidimonas sp. SYP-B2681 TaxID=2497686 RepID=UPI000F86463D|nr:nucleoside-diphosphate sugar epimerase/dehydratase [Candidimonas sp. SYP-B2681]RTZ42371.1 polysaccharide biosynthesis protein [Candidimonas sp. SYP-B2681]